MTDHNPYADALRMLKEKMKKPEKKIFARRADPKHRDRYNTLMDLYHDPADYDDFSKKWMYDYKISPEYWLEKTPMNRSRSLKIYIHDKIMKDGWTEKQAKEYFQEKMEKWKQREDMKEEMDLMKAKINAAYDGHQDPTQSFKDLVKNQKRLRKEIEEDLHLTSGGYSQSELTPDWNMGYMGDSKLFQYSQLTRQRNQWTQPKQTNSE